MVYLYCETFSVTWGLLSHLAEDPAAEKNTFLETLDYIFLTIFSIEMVLKIIAMGFVMRPHSYLRDPWNIVS